MKFLPETANNHTHHPSTEATTIHNAISANVPQDRDHPQCNPRKYPISPPGNCVVATLSPIKALLHPFYLIITLTGMRATCVGVASQGLDFCYMLFPFAVYVNK